jgi:hypothetical protein
MRKRASPSSECKQVCIAPVVTREGMPLDSEVFDGNRTEIFAFVASSAPIRRKRNHSPTLA